MAKCMCVISGDGGIAGELAFTQASEDAPTLIVGEIRGLSEGSHGIAVHAYGDLTNGAESTGPRFNPFGKAHGGPTDEERQVGDLGNIEAGADGVAKVHIEDLHVKLIGPLSVIGRSIVVYEGEDDLGKGGHEDSLTTGNAGRRIAAGVVGIADIAL